VLTDIYRASEKPIRGVGPELILESIKKDSPNVASQIITDREGIVDYFAKTLKPGDVFLTLGAGDVWKIGAEILERLSNRS